MPEPRRVEPQDVEPRIATGEATLVCAYEDEAKCHTYHIGGAISLSEFRQWLPSLERRREIVFYCA